MINRIAVKNFKSLKDVSVEMSYLNLFTGINGMGKSTLIQVLLLLKQSYFLLHDRRVLLNGELINIGYVSDALCESRDQELIVFELGTTRDEPLSKTFLFELFYENKTDKYLNIRNDIESENFDFAPIFKFQYLNAERIGPRMMNEINTLDPISNQLGIHGEYSIYYLYENQNKPIPIKELARDRKITLFDGSENYDISLKTQLEAWLSDISPSVVVKPELYRDIDRVSSFFAYKQNNQPDTASFKAVNVGFGISYILPVVLSILIAKKDDIVIIENPEAHLHPKGQSVLGELMALAAQNGVQLFIETHSDHIIDGIRIAIKDGKIDTKNANVLFFHRGNKEHVTSIDKIEIDNDGRYAKEPPLDFFDEFESNMMKLL